MDEPKIEVSCCRCYMTVTKDEGYQYTIDEDGEILYEWYLCDLCDEIYQDFLDSFSGKTEDKFDWFFRILNVLPENR